MIKAVVYHNGEQIKTYEFEKPLITIGRLPQNDIPINSMSISRMHLKIAYNRKKKAYFASDLSSLNGTFLDGVKISDETPLKSGVKLISGQFMIIPEFTDAPEFEETDNEDFLSAEPSEKNEFSEAEEAKTISFAANTGGIFFSTLNSGKKDEISEELHTNAFLIELNNKIIYKINKKSMSFGNSPVDDFYIGSGVFASENMATLTVSDGKYFLQSNTMMGKFKINGSKSNKSFLNNKDRIEFGSSTFTFKLKNG